MRELASVSAEALIAGKRIAPPPPPLRRCGPVVEQIGIKRSASPRLASLVGPAEDLKREVGKTSGRGVRVPQSEKERLQLRRRIAGLSSQVVSRTVMAAAPGRLFGIVSSLQERGH